MMTLHSMKRGLNPLWTLISLCFLVFNLGCESLNTGTTNTPRPSVDEGNPSSDRLNKGDRIRIMISDIPSPPPMIDMQIPESGKLVLHLNQEFQFAGKNRNELEREIRSHYIQKGYYNNIIVNIEVLARPVTVGGQVRTPGVLQYHSQMTVLRAIDGSGGFTDFANRRKVMVTRLSGEKFTVNCIRALEDPSLDLRIFPGDQIHVKKSVW